MAAVLACGDGAVLSHMTAAAAWGLWRGSSPLVHVTVPRPRGQRSWDRVAVHRSTRLPAEDIARKDGIPITRPSAHFSTWLRPWTAGGSSVLSTRRSG